MFEAWTLQQDQVREEDARLREHLRGLDDPQRAAFYRVYNRQLKDPDTYAVLNWCLLVGLHHFYLGRWLRGTINLALFLIGIACLLENPLIGIALIILVPLIELPALFRSQVIVADHNNQVAKAVMAELRIQGQMPSGRISPS